MEPWIGEVVGLMHLYRITQIELAKKIGVTNDYISMILNGKKSPKGIEQRIRTAIDEIIAEKKKAS